MKPLRAALGRDLEILRSTKRIGITEGEWRNDDGAIAGWEAWIGTIEPMIWAEGERKEYQRYREEVRQFNIEAVGTDG